MRNSAILTSTAVTMAASEEDRVGKFHRKGGGYIKFSEERSVAYGMCSQGTIAFSDDQIPIGLQFSVKILEDVDWVSPISTSSRPHTSDAPYTAGGAVHVVHCCLFFVYCDGVEGT